MIRRTFQQIAGVGPWRERDLWARGYTSWEALSADPFEALPKRSAASAQMRLAACERALADSDLGALGRLFPARVHWRLYPAFADEAVFFDIETEGMRSSQPTVVSLFSKLGLELFVAGRNLDALPEALARHRLWVTFNGACFDVPVLRAHFAHFPEPALHLDLRFIFHHLGFRGGLKAVERRLGLVRPPHLDGTNGADAVMLWEAFLATDSLPALRRLAEYNLYDTFQLRSLMELAYNQSVEPLFPEEPRLEVFERAGILDEVARILDALEADGTALRRAAQRG